jgi:hypothetical protein
MRIVHSILPHHSRREALSFINLLNHSGGPNTTDVYVVRVVKKESMLMTWVNSAGSSASSSWLELRMYSPESAALYCDETVKKEYSFATQDGRSREGISA